VPRCVRLKPFDVFVVLNVTFLVASVWYMYGRAEWEFMIYAAAVLIAGFAAWRILRCYDFPIWILLIVEVGLIAHFAGGILQVGPDNTALYWTYPLGIRFDKIVHAYNAFAGVLAIGHVFREADFRMGRLEHVVVVFVVLGIGAVVEVIEYFAVLVIPNTGVGDYANNMEDLIMNGVGGLVAVTFREILDRVKAS